MRSDEKKQLFKLLSVCLSYPDPAMVAALPEIEAAAAGLGAPLIRERLSAFTAHIGAEPLLHLQAHYTALFDLSPPASLNLTSHMGAAEERGRAMAGLLALYQRSGFEPAVSELPDYLPLMLEFLSLVPQAMSAPEVSRCLAVVPVILGHEETRQSVYAVPLEILSRMLPEAAESVERGASDPLSDALEE